MFTSRHSEPRTVLLWGDRWFFPEKEPSERFAHVKQAAALLATHFADEPKPVRLRLVFQPAALESVAVACPQGNRGVLATALAGDFPKLAQPDYSWGHEPVLPIGDGFSTILHHETEPALLVLAGELARLGLAVDSAWPLVTFLNALPEEWSESGATLVVSVRNDEAIAYHHPRDGGRTVLNWRGSSVIIDVADWLGKTIGEYSGDPALLICEDKPTQDAVISRLGDIDRSLLESLKISEALGRRVILPRYHSAQLLPRSTGINAQHAAIAASVLLFLAAGWAGFRLGQDARNARANLAAQQSRFAELQLQVAHLRENAAEVGSLRRIVEENVASPPIGALLRRVSATLPRDVALSSFHLNGRNFELGGWVAPGAAAGALEAWKESVSQPEIVRDLALLPSQPEAFLVSGVFLP